MLAKPDYTIEGQLKSLQTLDFKRAPLAVHALVEGHEVARSEVDDQGRYRLRFNTSESPPDTDLCVLPAELKADVSQVQALRETVLSDEFDQAEEGFLAVHDLLVSHHYLELATEITKTCRVFGNVYIAETTFFTLFPGAKIEFYEVDPIPLWVAGEWIDGVWVWHDPPPPTEAYLGSAVCDPQGSYSFTFKHRYPRFGIWPWTPDTKPDLLARIFQYVDGQWKKVFENPIDWDVEAKFRRDFVVPVANVYPEPTVGARPKTGFRFKSIGLLPASTSRIKKGYASAQPGDPSRIAAIKHQPFCGTLRIFGLFGRLKKVPRYRVQIAKADQNGPTGKWRDLADPLHNRRWSKAKKDYVHVVLGPDPVTGLYRNVDMDSWLRWHEPALKITWNTTNVRDGYYALRISGYDAKGKLIKGTTEQLPVLRIDNTRPEAKLKVLSPKASACGALALPKSREITFQVTAFDPAGHVLEYRLDGERGAADLPAGPMIKDGKPAASWKGVKDQPVAFKVDNLPAALAGCKTLSYNFELRAWGRATDCYNARLGRQYDRKEVNLVVTE